MIVGNHSYSHPAFSSLTMKESIEEIEKCESILEKLYQTSGIERVFRPFRFPYGDKGGGKKIMIQILNWARFYLLRTTGTFFFCMHMMRLSNSCSNITSCLLNIFWKMD